MLVDPKLYDIAVIKILILKKTFPTHMLHILTIELLYNSILRINMVYLLSYYPFDPCNEVTCDSHTILHRRPVH